MSTDLLKTLTYLSVHLTVGFSVAYALTGSVGIASGIALVEPRINAVAFFFHEKAWQHHQARPIRAQAQRDMPSALHHGPALA